MVLRSLAGHNDWSYDRSQHAMIDRVIGRMMPRLVARSIAGRHDWSSDQSHDTTIDRTIGRRTQWLTYDTIGRWSLPLVARLPTTDLAIHLLQSLVIARPRVWPIVKDQPPLEIAADIADRSHLDQIATNRTIQKSYDPVWLWFKCTLKYSVCFWTWDTRVKK